MHPSSLMTGVLAPATGVGLCTMPTQHRLAVHDVHVLPVLALLR